MTKKLFRTIMISIFCFFNVFCINAMADSNQKTIQVTFTQITSSSGYYSFKLFLYPYDTNHADGVPTALGTGFLNQYVTGISANKKNNIEFGYYDNQTQKTTWFPSSCKITLNQSENITVDIHSHSCNYTHQSFYKRN